MQVVTIYAIEGATVYKLSGKVTRAVDRCQHDKSTNTRHLSSVECKNPLVVQPYSGAHVNLYPKF